MGLKWVHTIIFASNVFHNSHLIDKDNLPLGDQFYKKNIKVLLFSKNVPNFGRLCP